MLRVSWERFGDNIRAQAIVDAKGLTTVQKELGLSHARMIAAAHGQPVGTDIFLTLCHWLQQDPMWFCTEVSFASGIEARSDETAQQAQPKVRARPDAQTSPERRTP